MPRPSKCRKVGFIPTCKYFLPDNKKIGLEDEVVLKIEEIEAIRLSDLMGFDQNQGAEEMNISRGTFQRIINCARQKIAEAMVDGKAIKIEGGNYIQSRCCACHMNCEKHSFNCEGQCTRKKE